MADPKTPCSCGICRGSPPVELPAHAPRPNVAELLRELGYDSKGHEIDETILWMAVEIKHLRQERPRAVQIVMDLLKALNHMGDDPTLRDLLLVAKRIKDNHERR